MERVINKMYFPDGYVCKHNQKVMDLANMIGRRDPKKNSYLWDDPEYVILEAGIDDDMADIALAMGYFTKRTAAQIAEITGKPEAFCHEQMMKLAEYGTSFVNKVDGVDTFWHAESWIPGVMEMIVNSLEVVKKYPIVCYAMEAYGRVRGPLSAGVFPPGIGLMRVIPIEMSIDGSSRKASYEEISRYLNENTVFSCSPCSCRTNREIMGEGCGHLKEDMCIQMGHAAEYYIRTKRAREITREEAFAILKRAEENGLMHQIPNIDGSGKTHAICNCCGCACMSLRTGNMYKNTDMLRSNYVAQTDKEKCAACGQCVENCPTNACKLGQKLKSKTPVTQNITTTRTPRDNDWVQKEWNPDYRINRAMTVDTGTASCKAKCPAHIAVQGVIKLAARSKYTEALDLIMKENPFPSVCAYMCSKSCEESCIRCKADSTVAISDIVKFIVTHENKSGKHFIPKKRNSYGDKKIAVIGSGPAGLSCAYFLALDGYNVTVFEKEQTTGGSLRNENPSFTGKKDFVDAEIAVIKELGVTFKTGTEAGKDISIDELRKQGYSAFFLAVGAQNKDGSGAKLSDILKNSAAVINKNNHVTVNEMTYQSAQSDIFAGGDTVKDSIYAIDAIAAGKQAAVSIHRFVQPGQDLQFGRNPPVFIEMNKDSAILENYNNNPSQRGEASDLFTEEMVRKEAERCLGCGATVVDEYMCVGCGICTVKCKFGAITLKRAYDGEGVEFLKIKKAITPHVIKRKVKIAVKKVFGRG